VDPAVVRERLLLLAEYIEDLQEFSTFSLEDLIRDKRDRRYLERTLQLAIEACLDIGSHLIAELRFREPEDNRDIFRILVENGILGPEKRDDLTRMAGFRNVLVHDYARLDPAKLHWAVSHGLADLRYFAREIKDRFIDLPPS
jgi:uncharacterized protein YutE (UPF0331/DUF86 family)